MTWWQEKSYPATIINRDAIHSILSLTRWILYPSFYLLDQLLCLYIPTFEDLKNGGISFTRQLFLSPLLGISLVLTLPIILVFYPIRCLLLTIREPFELSVNHTASRDFRVQDDVKRSKNQFGIATCNLCLMPESLSRLNSLKDVSHRSKRIGERIVIDQLSPERAKPAVDQTKDNNNSMGNAISDRISVKFQSLDFLMIQEAWSSYFNKDLITELHKVYPYIVHNTGVHSFSNNKFVLNSGLMVASRYPIIAVDVKSFINYCRHGSLTAQGVLLIQVSLGTGACGRRRVGYLFNTHLQSYSGDDIVIPKQMDELLHHINEFIQHTKGDNDEILFAFLCGDFNADNMSSGDKESQEHRLFDVFEDLGREKAGVDKDWTVGTEMRHVHMSEPAVSTAEGLKKVLGNPSLRRRYLVDADILKHTQENLVYKEPPCDDHGNALESPIGGRRRIDLITFAKAHPVKVNSYNFVTRLATLTDHIPVQMEFTCS